MPLNPVDLIDKYINTAYDKVQIVADNIDEVIRVADLSTTLQSSVSPGPTTRKDGSALISGDMWFEESTNITYTWNTISGTWINTVNVSTRKETFVVDATMRSTGIVNLANSYVLGVNNINVFVQGIYIDPAVYTETNSTRITFPVDTLVVSEEVDVIIGSTSPASSLPSSAVTYTTPRGFATDLNTVLGNHRIHTYATLSAAISKVAEISIGDVIICQERVTGQGNSITLDAIDATLVTENEIDIITGDAVVSLQVRFGTPINCRSLGLSSANTGTLNTNILNRAITLGLANQIAVYVPGTTSQYTVAPGIALTSKTEFYGDGVATSFKLEDGAVAVDVFTGGSIDIHIRDFQVDGNKANQTLNQNNFAFTTCTNLLVENVYSKNSRLSGIYTYNCNRSKIINNRCESNTFHGLEIEQCIDSIYTGNHCWLNSGHGVLCSEGATSPTGCHQLIINENQLLDNILNGIDVSGLVSDNISIQQNTIARNGDNGIYADQVGNTQTDSTLRAMLQIKDNLISRNGEHGIKLDAIHWSQIIGNTFDNNSASANGSFDELHLTGDAVIGWTGNNDIFHNLFIATDLTAKAGYGIREVNVSAGPHHVYHNSFVGGPVTASVSTVHPSSVVGMNLGANVDFETSGTFSGNGTGAVSSFSFPHLLDSTPDRVTVIPGSEDAIYTVTGAVKHVYYVTFDATNITITYPGTVPESGTNNVVFHWEAAATNVVTN